MAPTSPVKPTANAPSPGAAAPAASPATTTATAVTPVVSASTGHPPRGGSRSAARALLSANRQRADRPWIPASSAVIALPQSRRRSGSAATAAASTPPGTSIADMWDPVSDHRWRSTSRTASTHSSGGTTSHMTAVSSVGSGSACARATT
jgi:hypothetical protein